MANEINEIIEKLLDWCKENNYCASIDVVNKNGDTYLILILSYGRKEYNHVFNIKNGDISSENWKRTKCDLELIKFLKKAENRFKEVKNKQNNESATKIRPKGHWKKKEYWSEGCGMGEIYGHYYECSNCGINVKGDYLECSYSYCPYCGSDNRKEMENDNR